MTTQDKATISEFCWAELLVNDIDKEAAFYMSLFGWNKQAMPYGDSEFFVFQIGEVGIGGGMQFNEAMKSKQVPQHWNNYILVDDINKTVQAAKALGGTVLNDVTPVLDMGKMATLADPTGATFSLWQALKKNENAMLPKTTASNIGWNELVTQDIEKAGKFYAELFNWTLVTQEGISRDMPYTLFMSGDKPIAGMLAPCKEDTNGPRWDIYFSTDNLDECMNKAKSLGATVCYEPLTIAIGRFTMLRDPAGVFFSVIEYNK